MGKTTTLIIIALTATMLIQSMILTETDTDRHYAVENYQMLKEQCKNYKEVTTLETILEQKQKQYGQ